MFDPCYEGTHWKAHQQRLPSLEHTHTGTISLQPSDGMGGIGGMPQIWATIMPARMRAFMALASLGELRRLPLTKDQVYW
jgi:hypothetical protein